MPEIQTCIGNDIVDLNEKLNLNSFTKSRYLQKISFDREVELLPENIIKTAFIWANKEAAYKAVVKCVFGLNIFAPKDFVISNFIINTQGIFTNLTYIPANIEVKVKTLLHEDYYHSIACTKPFAINKIKCFVEKLNHNSTLTASEQVKVLLLRNLREVCEGDYNSFSIDNDKRSFPILIQTTKNHIDISLSHDGKYIACAFPY